MRERHRVRIIDLEKTLGFCIGRGISRLTSSVKDTPFVLLLPEIKAIELKYDSQTNNYIRNSGRVKSDIGTLFRSFGPTLWPDKPARHQVNWLANASSDDLDGHYPKDLYYSNPKDSKKLYQTFYNLVVAKCIRYRENNNAKPKRRRKPLITHHARRKTVRESTLSTDDHLEYLGYTSIDSDYSESIFETSETASTTSSIASGGAEFEQSDYEQEVPQPPPSDRQTRSMGAPVAQMAAPRGPRNMSTSEPEYRFSPLLPRSTKPRDSTGVGDAAATTTIVQRGDHPAWRPVNDTSTHRAPTQGELSASPRTYDHSRRPSTAQPQPNNKRNHPPSTPTSAEGASKKPRNKNHDNFGTPASYGRPQEASAFSEASCSQPHPSTYAGETTMPPAKTMSTHPILLTPSGQGQEAASEKAQPIRLRLLASTPKAQKTAKAALGQIDTIDIGYGENEASSGQNRLKVVHQADVPSTGFADCTSGEVSHRNERNPPSETIHVATTRSSPLLSQTGEVQNASGQSTFRPTHPLSASMAEQRSDTLRDNAVPSTTPAPSSSISGALGDDRQHTQRSDAAAAADASSPAPRRNTSITASSGTSVEAAEARLAEISRQREELAQEQKAQQEATRRAREERRRRAQQELEEEEAAKEEEELEYAELVNEEVKKEEMELEAQRAMTQELDAAEAEAEAEEQRLQRAVAAAKEARRRTAEKRRKIQGL